MGKKSKQKTTNEPSAYAKGYITPAAGALGSAYSANQPQIQGSADALWKQIPGMMEKAFTPSATVLGANTNLQDVLAGKYLNGSPHLQGIIDDTAGDVTDRVQSAFGRAGRTGSGANAGVLTKELASAENGLRYSNYNAERQAQMQALGLVPSIEGAQYAGIAPTLAAMQAAAGIPLDAANAYAGGTGNLLGQYNTSTTTKIPGLGEQFSMLMQNVGKVGQAAAVFSDRRLKANIERVGTLSDGLGVYDYDYVWGGERQRGVMADEVAQLRPWALGEPVNGFATVRMEAL
jgi:hypothetical protein